MCGQALAGQDIGGFESRNDEKWADPALLIRWTIAGAFLPWFRNHYNRNSKYFQEPFNFVEWFSSEDAHSKGFTRVPEPQDIYRKVLPICRCVERWGRQLAPGQHASACSWANWGDANTWPQYQGWCILQQVQSEAL